MIPLPFKIICFLFPPYALVEALTQSGHSNERSIEALKLGAAGVAFYVVCLGLFWMALS